MALHLPSRGAREILQAVSQAEKLAHTAPFFTPISSVCFCSLQLSLFIPEALPAARVLWVSAIGGMLGTIGLLVLYYSLTKGQMSIAAPVSALFAALLPVIVGSVTEGLPSLLQLIGFVLALAAVWLISQGAEGKDFTSVIYLTCAFRFSRDLDLAAISSSCTMRRRIPLPSSG